MKVYKELMQVMRAGKVRRIRESNNTGLILSWCGVLALLMLLASVAFADEIPDAHAINAVIGEAENQGFDGMLYVSCAVRNRGTLQGVYGTRAPRVRNKSYSQRIYNMAVSAWGESKTDVRCKNIDGATHWENINAFGRPYWLASMTPTLKYKDHVFYKRRK